MCKCKVLNYIDLNAIYIMVRLLYHDKKGLKKISELAWLSFTTLKFRAKKKTIFYMVFSEDNFYIILFK